MSRHIMGKTLKADAYAHATSAVLSRDLRQKVPQICHASGIYYYTECGRHIIDACGGSAVSCLGHDHARVKAAIRKQMNTVPYCHSQFFTTSTSEKLASAVIDSTDNKMARLLTLSSGSEALEAALKLARQYYLELPDPQPQRKYFIARSPSYHGATLTTLGIGGHTSRRAPFEPLLEAVKTAKVSQCNTYRGSRPGETLAAYVARLRDELDDAFSRFPDGSVCAFVAEPVTGASTGTVPPAPGYLAAVKEVCEKHGALLILDEVMCGMGRTGTMHAWQQENVVPNIQVIGKSFGAGYIPISGVLIDHDVSNVLESGSGKFSHGQSFQAHPSACAAALEVQNTIREENLLANVREMGDRLFTSLQAKLGLHPHVGDIRGRGLFWSIEFVKDKLSREPFPPELNVGYSVHELALQEPYNLCIYPGKGTVDGISGDHVLISPAYNVTPEEIDLIVDRLAEVLNDFFHKEKKVGKTAEVRQW
jgi:adenosylmethionine-8-amino-7-oxononanoate aminotransferase